MLLSQAMEDYLKVIYRLERVDDRCTTSALADAVGVTPASATNMLKRLAELKLVEHEPYRGVTLTSAGRRAALEIIRHHRLLEMFLQQALGYSWDEVDAEAERLEHAVTQEFMERIERALGHPTHDPHGHPIPNRHGEIAEPGDQMPLTAVTQPQRVRVVSVDDRDPALLRYVGAIGMQPGQVVEVLDPQPGSGPLTLRVEGEEHLLARDLASHISVAVEEG